MDLLSLIFTGIGLAMDASAVSIAKGMSLPNEKIKNYALKLIRFSKVDSTNN